jgi:hypothetical protein
VIDQLRVQEHPIWAERLKKPGHRTPPPQPEKRELL